MEVLINIPDAINEVRHFSEEDIVLALAIKLYIGEEVSLARAAEIAGNSSFAFQQLMAKKNIPLRYNLDDLDREMITANVLGGNC